MVWWLLLRRCGGLNVKHGTWLQGARVRASGIKDVFMIVWLLLGWDPAGEYAAGISHCVPPCC